MTSGTEKSEISFGYVTSGWALLAGLLCGLWEAKLPVMLLRMQFSIMAVHSIHQHNYIHRMTCCKIINWRTCLKLPEEPKVTKEARDLICHLLCDVESRLGTRGVDEIKVEDPQLAVPRVGPWRKMLTSKDSNFIGYIFKKSNMLKSVGTSGIDMKANGTSKPPSLVSLFLTLILAPI